MAFGPLQYNLLDIILTWYRASVSLPPLSLSLFLSPTNPATAGSLPLCYPLALSLGTDPRCRGPRRLAPKSRAATTSLEPALPLPCQGLPCLEPHHQRRPQAPRVSGVGRPTLVSPEASFVARSRSNPLSPLSLCSSWDSAIARSLVS
jgi:hypothetical protein